MEGFTEKRRSPRIIVDLVSVEVYTQSTDDAPSEIHEICQVRNISQTGMMFEGEKKFIAGMVLRLTFALPDSPIVIRTNATVIHSAKKRGVETGVHYKNLAVAEQKLLEHFIRKAQTRDD